MSDTPTPSDLQLLRAREVAALLKMSERSVYYQAAHGQLPFVKIGKSVRFRLSDLEKILGQPTAMTQ